MAEEVLDKYNLKRRRIEGRRPVRFLSYVSKSAAFQNAESEKRIERGVDFFFPIERLPFETTAFKNKGPGHAQDENKFHHPYFLAEMESFIESALSAQVQIRQRLHWSQSGQWMKLDDGTAAGVEPDFCTTEKIDANEKLVPDPKGKAKPPTSKYDVSVSLEMKKGFTETDQVECVDYGERMLCFQRGRRCAYTALFHCCGDDKVIRWVETCEKEGEFHSRISRPESLVPGGKGQQQLLAILKRSSSELGLDFPLVQATDSDEVVRIASLIGEGATSTVYAASFRGRDGVLKLLKPGFCHLADHEANTLMRLESQGVRGAPTDCLKVCDRALFFGQELTHLDSIDTTHLERLVECLKGAHEAGIVHRDVRPDNLLQDPNGRVCLIDWGFSHHINSSLSPPNFEGTFRFASDEALDSAVKGEQREPTPSDDLESVVKLVLSLSQSSLRNELVKIASGDLKAAQQFWLARRDANKNFEWMFDAARRCDYEGIKGLLF